MLASLVMPIILSAVALFFASFLAWMVVPLHAKDWRKLDNEDQLITAVQSCGIPPGSYMFPGCATKEEMQSEAFKRKQETGPCGILTIFPKISMGRNLALTFLYYLAVSFLLGYLAMLGLKPGVNPMTVFRFVSTAGFMTFLAAIVPHSIWFRSRIAGHVIESIADAVIVGAIFAALWPAS